MVILDAATVKSEYCHATTQTQMQTKANANADQGLLVIETGNPVKYELASKQKTTSRNKKKM